eukprot:g20462.t1
MFWPKPVRLLAVHQASTQLFDVARTNAAALEAYKGADVLPLGGPRQEGGSGEPSDLVSSSLQEAKTRSAAETSAGVGDDTDTDTDTMVAGAALRDGPLEAAKRGLQGAVTVKSDGNWELPAGTRISFESLS